LAQRKAPAEKGSSGQATGRANCVQTDEPPAKLGQTEIAWSNAKRAHVQPAVAGCDRRFRATRSEAAGSARLCRRVAARRQELLLILGGGDSEIEARK